MIRMGRSGMTRVRRHVLSCGWQCSSVVALTLACGAATPAAAEVNVEGNAAAVRVVTSRDTVADVLSALGTTFNVRYRSATALDAAAQASYSGSVEQVIARLLDGYNYVIKRKAETIEV